MNLRTLKKLSKRAAPLLVLLGDTRRQFPAAKHDNFHHAFIGDRKHWERGRCHPTYEARNSWTTPRGAEIIFTTRTGRTMVMRPPSYARKATVMVGALVGHYEPEWEEESAWTALENLVYDHFTDYFVLMYGDGGVLTRDLSTPSKVIAAARDMIAEKGGAA